MCPSFTIIIVHLSHRPDFTFLNDFVLLNVVQQTLNSIIVQHHKHFMLFSSIPKPQGHAFYPQRSTQSLTWEKKGSAISIV